MEANESSMDVYKKDEITGLTTFTVLIIVLAIPANALVILAFLVSRTARQKPSNYLLVNFTISEFITAVLVIPLQLVVNIVKPRLAFENGALCTVVGVTSYPFYIVSVGTMVCISIDRLYAILYPLRYRTRMSGKRIACMISFTWLHATTFAFVFGFVVGVGRDTDSVECGIRWKDMPLGVSLFVAATHIVLPFVMLALLNYNLVVSLRKQNRTFEGHFEKHLRLVADGGRGQKNKVRQAQERKVSCMVLWIITTYLICWIPYFVTRSLFLTPVVASPLINAIAVLVLHLSVVINPMLNLTFRKEVRFAIKRLFSRGEKVSPTHEGRSRRTFMTAVDGHTV